MIEGDESLDMPPQPIQFGLSKLMQFVSVAALWCAAPVVKERVMFGIAYTLVTTIVSWVVVGRWAVSLSPKACRHVLALATTLLISGSVFVSILVDDASHAPYVWLLVYFAVALLLMELAFEAGAVVGGGVVAVSAALMLLVVYLVWLVVFRSWDRASTKPTQNRLARSFSALLVLLTLPVLFGVFNAIHHSWLHCVVHVGLLPVAGVIIGSLQRHARHSTAPPPNWLKLLTLGYLCVYAVLLQVALFPIDFYIP